MTEADPRDDEERDATWRLHSLAAPTFSDITQGVFIGVVWSFVLWAPMFLSALLA